MYETIATEDDVEAGLAFLTLDSMIHKYMKMEQTSLLELALWKASIADGVFFSRIDDAREYAALEETFDSQEYIRNARIASGCETVIPLVMAFLG